MYRLHLAYSLIFQWTLSSFHIVATAICEHGCTKIPLRPNFQFCGGTYPEVGLLDYIATLFIYLFIYLFLQYWGLNPGPTPWATLPALFLWCDGFSEIRFWELFAPAGFKPWSPDLCLWVARITSVSHWSPALFLIFWETVTVFHSCYGILCSH
jgi:hypothetical protein